LHVEVCARFNGIVYNLSPRALHWRGPDSETEFATRSQNTERFCARLFRARKVQQTEIYQHPIKARIVTGQILSVALSEWNPREHMLRDCHHFFGEIDAR
jgi:hypothetical protein